MPSPRSGSQTCRSDTVSKRQRHALGCNDAPHSRRIPRTGKSADPARTCRLHTAYILQSRGSALSYLLDIGHKFRLSSVAGLVRIQCYTPRPDYYSNIGKLGPGPGSQLQHHLHQILAVDRSNNPFLCFLLLYTPRKIHLYLNTFHALCLDILRCTQSKQDQLQAKSW